MKTGQVKLLFACVTISYAALAITGIVSGANAALIVSLLFAGVAVWYIFYCSVILPEQKRWELLNDPDKDIIQEMLLDKNTIDDPFLKKMQYSLRAYKSDVEREHSARILDKQTRINALQSQINPHFLYNTLESIRGQAIAEGNREIAAMIEALASFFRYSISHKHYLVTLREEIANVRNYFLIQEYRFNGKFSLELITDGDSEVMECYVPRLTIQPIVENAIFHGLEKKSGKGKVTIRMERTEKRLLIMVSDDGIGMDVQTLNMLNDKILKHSQCSEGEEASRGAGIALVNVNKRIELVFGQEYGLHIYSTKGMGTDVEIVLPLIRDKSI